MLRSLIPLEDVKTPFTDFVGPRLSREEWLHNGLWARQRLGHRFPLIRIRLRILMAWGYQIAGGRLIAGEHRLANRGRQYRPDSEKDRSGDDHA